VHTINLPVNVVKFSETLEAVTSGSGMIATVAVSEGTLRSLVTPVCTLWRTSANRA
jgi:hypothetical protein